MIRHTTQVFILVIASCVSCQAADLRFAMIFTDHCVLQRELPVPVWGWAEPGSQVTLKFADQKKTATADGNGKWQLRLEPMQASRESRDLTVSSSGQSVALKDVLVGEVWLAGGESNQGRAEAYRRQLPTMVSAWRSAFERDDLAFLAVRLPAFGKVRDWPRSPWAEMRESIALLETSLPHTASVVSTDCGLPSKIHLLYLGSRRTRAALTNVSNFRAATIRVCDSFEPSRFPLSRLSSQPGDGSCMQSTSC